MAKQNSGESKDLAVQQQGGAIAAYDYGTEAGAGFEGTKGTDLSIPFLAILQSNSPQVEADDPKGAKAGMLFNTVTRELMDGEKGLVFLPVHKDYAFVEWIPRTKGGGFVAMHDPAGTEVAEAQAKFAQANNGKKFGKLTIGDNDLVETFYVYGLILDEAGKSTLGFGVISFTSTKIKPQKDWFTSMYMLKGRPPLFANRARIRTFKDKNEKGTFFNFRIDPFRENFAASLINPKEEAELLKEAKDFRDMVMKGVAKADFGSQNAAAGANGDAGEGAAPF